MYSGCSRSFPDVYRGSAAAVSETVAVVFIRAVLQSVSEIRNFDGSDSYRRIMFLISVEQLRVNTNIFSVKLYFALLILFITSLTVRFIKQLPEWWV
jgi:hypothetical protein